MCTKVLGGLSWKFGFEDVISSGPNKHTSFVAWFSKAFTPSGGRTRCELWGAELVYVF